MAQTTLEEAKNCPKCGNPGEDRKVAVAPRTLPRGTTIHHIYCASVLCPWYNTPWMIQVNPDGTVPAPKNHTKEPKLYHGFDDHDDEAKRLIDILKANEVAQTVKGAEMRRP